MQKLSDPVVLPKGEWRVLSFSREGWNLTFEQGLEVKKSGFGMGVFLTEPAKVGDLISGMVLTSC